MGYKLGFTFTWGGWPVVNYSSEWFHLRYVGGAINIPGGEKKCSNISTRNFPHEPLILIKTLPVAEGGQKVDSKDCQS